MPSSNSQTKPNQNTGSSSSSSSIKKPKKKQHEFVNIMFFDNQITSECFENPQGKAGNLFHWKVQQNTHATRSGHGVTTAPIKNSPHHQSQQYEVSSTISNTSTQSQQTSILHSNNREKILNELDQVERLPHASKNTIGLNLVSNSLSDLSNNSHNSVHVDNTSSSFTPIIECDSSSTSSLQQIRESNYNHLHLDDNRNAPNRQDSYLEINHATIPIPTVVSPTSQQTKHVPEKRIVRSSISIKELLNQD